jgi:hypothetical protein
MMKHPERILGVILAGENNTSDLIGQYAIWCVSVRTTAQNSIPIGLPFVGAISLEVALFSFLARAEVKSFLS